jgi:hypothetical protein
VAADIAAGFGYLAGSLATAATEVVLFRNRHRFAQWQIDQVITAGARAPRGWRWAYRTWRDERWQDEEFRRKRLVWTWLPPIMFLPLLALVFFVSAIAEFRR